MPTATTPGYTEFRGRVACICLATWYPAFEAELQRRGLLVGPLGIYQLVGTSSKSANTHSNGGAGDDNQTSDEATWVARQMGADASWARPYNWDGDGGGAHAHRVLTGCPHNGPARYQIDAVIAGFNGLGTGGRGASDPGPRPLSGRTWREGIAWALEQGDDMPFTEDQLRTIVREEAEKAARKVLDEELNINDPKGDPRFRGMSLRAGIKRILTATGAVPKP